MSCFEYKMYTIFINRCYENILAGCFLTTSQYRSSQRVTESRLIYQITGIGCIQSLISVMYVTWYLPYTINTAGDAEERSLSPQNRKLIQMLSESIIKEIFTFWLSKSMSFHKFNMNETKYETRYKSLRIRSLFKYLHTVCSCMHPTQFYLGSCEW